MKILSFKISKLTKSHIFTFLDTPGHYDIFIVMNFTVRLCDVIFIVVDFTEGLMINTDKVI